MILIEADWERYENPSADVKENTVILASANGTAGTVEEIRWHPETRCVYRRRYWHGGRFGAAGEVWFTRKE